MAKEIAYKVTVDTSEVDEGVEKTTDSVEDLGKATKKTSKEMKSGFQAAEQGTKKLGTSIGGLIKSLGVIGVALAVFEFMRDILSKNQKVMDALNTATTALEIVIYKVFDAVEPLGDAMKSAFEDPQQAVLSLWESIKENLLNRFEGVILQFKALGSVIEAAIDLDWDGVKEGASDFATALVQTATGLDEVQQKAALDGIKNFAKDVQAATVSAVEQADALVQLRKEVELGEIARQKLQLTYQQEAESQRQIRDDITKTIAARMAANEELGRILNEQIEKEKEFAQQKLELANAEIAITGDTIENLRLKGEAELALREIEERVESQRSEQLTNRNALIQEEREIEKQIRLEKLEEQELEIEEFIQHAEEMNELARLAGEEEVYTEEEIERQKLAITKKYNDARLTEEQQAAVKAIQIAQAEKDAKLQAASALAAGLGSVVAGIAGQSKASVAIQKTLAIAQIAIDTARSISSAIASATQAAAATGPGAVVATPVFIATQIATVLAAVGQAVAVLNSAGGGGTATIPTVSTPTASPTPTFDPVTTNTTELGGTTAAELAPVQAYVVETQITGSQENISQIEGQAEFGLGG